MRYSVQWGSGNPANCHHQRGVEGIRDHPKRQTQTHHNQREVVADKVWSGDSSQDYANKAMTKMQAEAAEAKVVLIDWSTPERISQDTKEAIAKWCFETSGNDADIAAMPRPSKFPRWNFK